WLRPILPVSRRLPDRVIEADADGYPRLDPELVLIDCWLPEAAARERAPGSWPYLEDGKRPQVHTSFLATRRTPWRFLWNQSQATAHNVHLLLYPKSELKNALKRKPALYEAIFSALRSLDTASITGNGRVYRGGLFKMEPKEWAAIP